MEATQSAAEKGGGGRGSELGQTMRKKEKKQGRG